MFSPPDPHLRGGDARPSRLPGGGGGGGGAAAGVAGAGLSSGWLRILPDMEGFRLMWGEVCRTDDCVWVFI